jgi:DNA-directed RNA polymerase subunit omega
MLEELKEEEIVKKVGGRFKLSTLIQKRMVALNRGAKQLVEIQTKNPMEVVIQEIIQDKIFLDASGAVVTRADQQPTRERHFDSGPSLDDL